MLPGVLLLVEDHENTVDNLFFLFQEKLYRRLDLREQIPSLAGSQTALEIQGDCSVHMGKGIMWVLRQLEF